MQESKHETYEWRYPGNVTNTKHRLPEAQSEGKMKQIITKQTENTLTHKQKRTATDEPPWKVSRKTIKGLGGYKSLCPRMTKSCLFKYNEILLPKNENFQTKNSDIFHISALNVDCGYSLEPPRLCFWAKNRKNNVYPCKPQFYFIKMRFKGVKII